MSEENVERILSNVDSWNRGDREAWLSDANPDWEFRTSGVFPGLKPVYRGREGAIELWNAMREPWKRFQVDVERVEALGEDQVVCLVTFNVEGRDGLTTSRKWAYLVTFAEGFPIRTENFAEWTNALEAAGLSE